MAIKILINASQGTGGIWLEDGKPVVAGGGRHSLGSHWYVCRWRCWCFAGWLQEGSRRYHGCAARRFLLRLRCPLPLQHAGSQVILCLQHPQLHFLVLKLLLHHRELHLLGEEKPAEHVGLRLKLPHPSTLTVPWHMEGPKLVLLLLHPSQCAHPVRLSGPSQHFPHEVATLRVKVDEVSTIGTLPHTFPIP